MKNLSSLLYGVGLVFLLSQCYQRSKSDEDVDHDLESDLEHDHVDAGQDVEPAETDAIDSSIDEGGVVDPDLQDDLPGEISDIARFCVIAMSCTYDYHSSVGECVFDTEKLIAYYGPSIRDERMSCVFSAGNDCHAVALCIWHDGTEPELCDESDYESSCDGNIAYNCMESTVSMGDCSHLFSVPDGYELFCTIDPDGQATCEGLPCEGFVARCNGNIVEYCNAWFFDGLTAQDCLTLYPSSACSTDDEGNAGCAGNGPACIVGEHDDWCEGDTFVDCFNGREASIDCSLIGANYTCRLDGLVASCSGKGTECAIENEAGDYTDSCSGTILSYCHAGFVESVDCIALGFSSCISYATGGARCE
jgi:hypothetical protein